MSGRRWALLGLGIVVLGVGAYFLFLSEDGGIPGLRKPPPLANAAVTVAELKAIDAQDRPEAAQKAQTESTKITDMLNRFYTLAVLRPERWATKPEEGSEVKPADAELSEFFTEEARPSVAPNLGALALADTGASLERVDPTKQQATKVTFAVQDDLSLPFVIVTVSYEAKGKAKEKANDPVSIVHNATYWLSLQPDGSYKISAYNAELKADTAVKTSSFGVPEKV
jgi:hypothetical protein